MTNFQSNLKEYITIVEQGRMPLLEMDWLEKSPLVKILQNYRGKWIHFTRGVQNRKLHPADPAIEHEPLSAYQAKYPYNPRKAQQEFEKAKRRSERMNADHIIPKIGFNTGRKSHQDINGIYFYPIDWILNSRHERVLIGQQYGLDFKYYYIADLNLADVNGITLQNVTWDKVDSIAQKNGWKDQLDQYKTLDTNQQKEFVGMNYVNMQHPGDFLWHFIERLVRNNTISWAKAFRNTTYIYDNNGSIIHNNEPHQIVVLNPKIISVVKSGEVGFAPSSMNADKPEHWQPAFIDIMKGVRGELGGELIWAKKEPTLSFNSGNAKFVMTISNSSWGGQGLSITYTYRRAEGSFSINRKQLEDLSKDQIVQTIITRAKTIGSRKTDLLFKPIMSIEKGKQFIRDNLLNGSDISYNVKISNPESPEDLKWCRVEIMGTVKHEIADVLIETRVMLELKSNDFDISCYVSVNGGRTIVNAYTSNDFNLDQVDQALDELSEKLAVSIDGYLKLIGPSRYGNSWERWNNEDELKIFGGWLALNCGLNLHGKLEARMVDEITAYKELAAKPPPIKRSRYDDEIRVGQSPLQEFMKELSYQMKKLNKSKTY